MAAARLPMRKLREIVRLKLHVGLSGRQIAKSCNLSPGTVSDYVGRISAAKLSWPLPPELDDDEALERLLFYDPHKPVAVRPEPNWPHVHQELRRQGVTKLLLWQEYKEQHPDGLQYSQFCDKYLGFAARLSVTMRQTHRAGEKLFVDFSGDGIEVVDSATGECRKAKLFVATLGASSYTYVEPVFTEDLPTWLGCHVRTLEFLGGVPEIFVPDNLKSGVTKPDYYDPDINRSYADLAAHYGVVVIPARVRKPRDKAKVEQAVLLAERWILAVLRHRTFYSLAELREAVKPLVVKLNDRPMRRLGKSRRQLFEALDRPALRPLPARPYEFAQWAKVRVHFDYHVEFDRHFYSVPYQLVGERLDVRATESTIEILRGGTRVTSHLRSSKRGGHTTKPEHMPKSHREYAEWDPPRLIAWAATVGPFTAALIEEIMRRRKHAEHGFRSCLGILRLTKTYPAERIERACARAVKHHTFTCRSVTAILRNNLDADETLHEPAGALPAHGNVRGADYYH